MTVVQRLLSAWTVRCTNVKSRQRRARLFSRTVPAL
jgi:hypothetical protein